MNNRFKFRVRLLRPLLLPLIIYLGLVMVSSRWVEDHPGLVWNWLVALLPMIPGLFVARGVVRAVRQLDELEQKTLLEGMVISFACTLILTTSLGLLNLSGFPPVNGLYIALFMSVTWLLGKLWRMRKY